MIWNAMALTASVALAVTHGLAEVAQPSGPSDAHRAGTLDHGTVRVVGATAVPTPADAMQKCIDGPDDDRTTHEDHERLGHWKTAAPLRQPTNRWLSATLPPFSRTNPSAT